MSIFIINAGELRHRITFQNLDKEAQNEYGEPIEKWIEVKSVRCAIYPVSGKEFYAAETVNSEVTHKIKLRYTTGLTPDMRIIFGKRIFSIISIINFQERNKELQIMAKELL